MNLVLNTNTITCIPPFMDKLYLPLNHVYEFFTLMERSDISYLETRSARSNLTTDRTSVNALPGSPTLTGLSPAVARDKPGQSGPSYENHQCHQLPA